METINHETYCGHNLITLLLKAGFDWKEYFIAHDINEHFHWEIPLHIAQRWLREVKNIDINILVESISSHKQYLVSIWFNISDKSACDNAVLDNRYSTYEEALEAGIKKALEIILEKGK